MDFEMDMEWPTKSIIHMDLKSIIHMDYGFFMDFQVDFF